MDPVVRVDVVRGLLIIRRSEYNARATPEEKLELDGDIVFRYDSPKEGYKDMKVIVYSFKPIVGYMIKAISHLPRLPRPYLLAWIRSNAK